MTKFISFAPSQVCVYSLPSPLAPFTSLWGDHLEESLTEEHYCSCVGVLTTTVEVLAGCRLDSVPWTSVSDGTGDASRVENLLLRMFSILSRIRFHNYHLLRVSKFVRYKAR